MAAPIDAIDVGLPVSALSGCPITTYERSAELVLAAGYDHLTMLSVQPGCEDEPSKLQRVPLKLHHEGALDAIAWGHVADEPRIAAVGSGVVAVHRLGPGQDGDCPRIASTLPGVGLASTSARSCCFLQSSNESLAVTGDNCRCYILRLQQATASTTAAPAPALIDRTLTLGSPGVAVRTHSREPSQLMVAEEDGKVHFYDMRAPPSARPSLARDVPAGEADAGGLRDADWSSYDPYLVGGVCGKRWVVWDLRQAGLAPPPLSGDAQASGALSFRWHPHAATFATAGATGEHTRAHVQLHEVQPPDAAPETGTAAGWAAMGAMAGTSPPQLFAHDLPTRVAAVTWLFTRPARLLGAADTKVCLWHPGGGQQSAIM